MATAAAVVRIRVSDMEWFQTFAASVLDLVLAVEDETVLVTDEMKRHAAEIRVASDGVFPASR